MFPLPAHFSPRLQPTKFFTTTSSTSPFALRLLPFPLFFPIFVAQSFLWESCHQIGRLAGDQLFGRNQKTVTQAHPSMDGGACRAGSQMLNEVRDGRMLVMAGRDAHHDKRTKTQVGAVHVTSVVLLNLLIPLRQRQTRVPSPKQQQPDTPTSSLRLGNRLLYQPRRLLRKTKAVNVPADRGAVRMNHLEPVDDLLLDPDAGGTQGPDTNQILNDIVVGKVGRRELLREVGMCAGK